jgi:hypothetical protein
VRPRTLPRPSLGAVREIEKLQKENAELKEEKQENREMLQKQTWMIFELQRELELRGLTCGRCNRNLREE